jgi:glycosyltransferase involved in cell wall biosynthesis
MAAGADRPAPNVRTLLFANTDWYLYNFRLPLAEALRSQGYDVVLVSPAGEYTEKLTKAGFRWVAFPFSRKGWNPFQELATIMRLVNLYRLEKPDFVHHFTIKCVLYGSIAAKWVGIRRVINSITGLGYLFIGNSLGHKILRPIILFLYRTALRSTRVIFQNRDDLRQFEEDRLVLPDQVDIVRGSGVDTVKFSVNPLPQDPQQVVLPARLLWDKGVGEFVEAARILLSEGIQAKFILAGDSDDQNPAGVPVNTLKKWQEEGIITWPGWQGDMPAVYARAGIVCLPSYREGLPKTLIEAAACGRPLVAFDAPGSREVVIPGETGLLAKFKDSKDLAECLRTLLNDPEARERMGRNARQLAETEFSNERILRETLMVYSKLQGDVKPQ